MRTEIEIQEKIKELRTKQKDLSKKSALHNKTYFTDYNIQIALLEWILEDDTIYGYGDTKSNDNDERWKENSIARSDRDWENTEKCLDNTDYELWKNCCFEIIAEYNDELLEEINDNKMTKVAYDETENGRVIIEEEMLYKFLQEKFPDMSTQRCIELLKYMLPRLAVFTKENMFLSNINEGILKICFYNNGELLISCNMEKEDLK